MWRPHNAPVNAGKYDKESLRTNGSYFSSKAQIDGMYISVRQVTVGDKSIYLFAIWKIGEFEIIERLRH
jgi:hypothetical protein